MRPTRLALMLLPLSALFAIASAPLAVRFDDAPKQPGSEAHAIATNENALSDLLKALSPLEQLYFQHDVSLSGPFFEGRAPGLRGNDLAAEYCQFFFKRAGLTPLFPTETTAADGSKVETPRSSYLQRFQDGTDTTLISQSLVFLPPAQPPEAANVKRTLESGKDFVVMGQSGQGHAEGPIVFVGYSIDDGQDGYNTFTPAKDAEGDKPAVKTEDLTGKIALMLRFEPKNEKGKSKFTGDLWSNSAAIAGKLQRTIVRGASAILIVSPPGADDPRADVLEAYAAQGRNANVPVMLITSAQASSLVRGSGVELADLVKSADEKGFVQDLPGSRVTLDVQLKKEPVMTQNVAGVLAGRGPLADQFIIIGGHYDHLGYGHYGSRDANPVGKLHPGADDNASGASGVLLAAEILAEKYKALPAGANSRSIIFMTFSGEEKGLDGSRFFVKHSPIEASKIDTMLNMDMIGRLREGRLEVDGVGSADGFDEFLKPLFAATGLDIRTLPGGQGPSDHASFYAAGVPVLHFFTGLHPQYHMPVDTFATINAPGAVKVVNTLVTVALAIAQRPESFVFKRASGPSINMNEDLSPPTPPKAAAATDPNAGGTGLGGVKVRFGIAPGNYAGDDGIEIGDVYDKTSASEAGLKKGDRITKWNGTEVRDVESWMPLLAKQKPGDVVEIVYVRGKETLTTKATLKARETGDR